jgi:hypothetical protein
LGFWALQRSVDTKVGAGNTAIRTLVLQIKIHGGLLHEFHFGANFRNQFGLVADSRDLAAAMCLAFAKDRSWS